MVGLDQAGALLESFRDCIDTITEYANDAKLQRYEILPIDEIIPINKDTVNGEIS